jgi:predicted nucleotidyltransferase
MDNLFDKAPKWLDSHTIFLTLGGSRAYGTSTPESDTDYRGICTLPKEYVFGFNKTFEQYELKAPDPDLVIISLKKWASLAVKANPNTLELLYVDYACMLKATPAYLRLRDIRDAFLSKRIATSLSEYGRSQLHEFRKSQDYLLPENKRYPFGYNSKALMHYIRLMLMCLECLEDRTLYVKRPDAEELLSIRNGAWDYNETMCWAEVMEAKIKAALQVTKLPDAPNLELIEETVMGIIEEGIK